MKLQLHILGLCGLLFVAFESRGQIISAKEVVGKYRNTFKAPPSKTPSNVAVDGPLLGNGSVAVTIAGSPEQQNFYLARNDFWRLKPGYNESFPAVLGKIQIDIPSLKSASYNIEQDLYHAVTIASFSKGDTSVRIQSEVVATKDWLIIKIENTGRASIEGKGLLLLPQADQLRVNPHLENKNNFPDTTTSGNDLHGMQWIQRGFVKDVAIKTLAAAAFKIVGSESNAFSIEPGQKITMVCALSGNFKNADCLQFVQHQIRKVSMQLVEDARKKHKAWWDKYWNESYVAIGDSLIEQLYYKSQYNMASCSRDPKFPPGIFGSWVTREIPNWNGDYHLNYNYQAPFYALYSSNHLLQALPYEAPVIDFFPRGIYYSEKITGIPGGTLYPVGIGPLGIETTRKNKFMIHAVEDEGLFFGQKSNAAYCVTNLSSQFYRTYDVSFTKRVYPFVRSVAVFWQHYLKKENDRYIIENDAIHEGTIGTMNPILSLGLVPMVFKTAMDMSVLLGVDDSLRKDWQEKSDHLPAFPLQVRDGKTVFRYSEKGTDWWSGNTLGIQHIYPAGQIGLNSDSRLLDIARNTIREMNRWLDVNGSNSFFPAAVRVGFNADTILAKLREYALHTYANGFQLDNPHGIENCSTVPNAINEMLCMSHQNVLRVFAVWPKERDASFSNIRCEGAFLVSAVLKKGLVEYVKITSEKGRVCVLQNPWPGKTILVKSNKKAAMKNSGDRINLATVAGEEIWITVEP